MLESLYLKNIYFENICKRQEAVARRCSVKVLLDISQNSQENNCARVPFLIKFQASPATLLKKRLGHRSFPVNFAKFLRTPFITGHLRWLLMKWILQQLCLYKKLVNQCNIGARSKARLVFRTHSNIQYGALNKNRLQLKAFEYFRKELHPRYLNELRTYN